MDYAATAGQTSAPKPIPELGRLKAAAERTASATNRVESFIGRFHGPQPAINGSNPGGEPAEGYRNDIDCLFAQIDRLTDAVNSLETIG